MKKQIVANAEFNYVDPGRPDLGMLFSYEEKDGLSGAIELTQYDLQQLENHPSVFLDKLNANLSVMLDRFYPKDTSFSVDLVPTEQYAKFKLIIEVENAV